MAREQSRFLPTSQKEMAALGWQNVDIVLFTGDAYIDHPAFGTAVIARVLEREGYRVAVVPQPNWRDDLRDFKKMGRPRLFFGVNSGAMDSMVNHYTAAKRLRSNDAYTPNGTPSQRPDYAVKVYTNILKELYPDVPVVIGGIEASLRRFAHYDYWQDKLLPSILVDSKADYLIYGMGEKSIVEVASYIKKYHSALKSDDVAARECAEAELEKLRQVAWLSSRKPQQKPGRIILRPFRELLKDKRAFVENFNQIETEANRVNASQLVEPVDNGKYVYVNPPQPLLTSEELDSYYALPYTKLPHPRYKEKHIPAYEMIKYSITTHRGCFGGCSFCTIAAHQGKHIQSRSEESILNEIEKLTAMPGFAGNLSDVGAPTANMYGMGGMDETVCGKCFRKSCLFPKVCPNLRHSHWRLLKLYERIRKIPGIRHAYIGSGIRYDLFLDEKGFLDNSSQKYLNELIVNHTSGRLKVAPEHTQDSVLKQMNKPSFKLFETLKREFDKVVKQNRIKCELVPYFISSHPGCSIKEMELLSQKSVLRGVYMDQVQDFTPTPMTKSSVSYYSGLDPKTLQPIFVEKNPQGKKLQKSYFFKK
ncbi:MAG: YgiQ family radical SAM protein [Bacteroidales bacterium]|nr:YgiQ family radical SAM protein [Bacteroidales bacterium]